MRILTEPKNALVKQYKRMFEFEESELSFTDESLRAIAREALEHGTGARGLRSICERVLQNVMYDLRTKVLQGGGSRHRYHGGDHPG